MTKTAAPPDPIKLLDAHIKTVEAKRKDLKGVVHWASESPPVYHLPFSNPHLNYATEGGAPWDRFVALYGDESTGKTLAAMQLVATAQQLPHSAEELILPRISYHMGHGHTEIVQRLKEELEWIEAHFPTGANCMWHDIEGQFDKIRAQKVGIDTDRLLMSETQVVEEICGVLGSYFSMVHMHVLDSTSNATTYPLLKKEPGQGNYGTAKIWKEALRDTETYFGTKNSGIPNMVVMIHQMSMNVRTGSPEASVGKFLKFTSSCSVRFQRGKFLWRKEGVLMDDKTKSGVKDEESMAGRAEPDGVEVYAKIEKSRTCRPFRVAAMQFDYKSLNYDDAAELFSSGTYFGIITVNGSWYATMDENGEEIKLGQGKKAVYERLRVDTELAERIYCRLLDYTHDT